jgi:hypothetical protein
MKHLGKKAGEESEHTEFYFKEHYRQSLLEAADELEKECPSVGWVTLPTNVLRDLAKKMRISAGLKR